VWRRGAPPCRLCPVRFTPPDTDDEATLRDVVHIDRKGAAERRVAVYSVSGYNCLPCVCRHCIRCQPIQCNTTQSRVRRGDRRFTIRGESSRCTLAMTNRGLPKPMPADESPSATLAVKLATGDAQAFQELVNREGAGLIRYATAILGSREDARDAAQETFFRLWQTRARLDHGSDPVRLLYTIIRNLARDRLRHRAVEQRPHPLLETPHVVQAGPLLAEEGEDADDLQAVMQLALETLSPRQREIVLLRWKRQLTYEQIAAELGIAPGTASVHMQRAIGQLKVLLPRLLGEWRRPETGTG
jgi:RNA polymerase sigma-70 factor (ECF subfamily)